VTFSSVDDNLDSLAKVRAISDLAAELKSLPEQPPDTVRICVDETLWAWRLSQGS
jgi:hypothetical protein